MYSLYMVMPHREHNVDLTRLFIIAISLKCSQGHLAVALRKLLLSQKRNELCRIASMSLPATKGGKRHGSCLSFSECFYTCFYASLHLFIRIFLAIKSLLLPMQAEPAGFLVPVAIKRSLMSTLCFSGFFSMKLSIWTLSKVT